MNRQHFINLALIPCLLLVLSACSDKQSPPPSTMTEAPAAEQAATATAAPSDAAVEDIINQAYRFVAMYNVNNKMAMQSGWNNCAADTKLKDHTLQLIARPNNDTLYIMCSLDLRKAPMVLEFPAFDSKYVSLMVTAYDHYVTVPLSVTKGDFQKPEKLLFYSARTEGYSGEPVEGIDRVIETSGDFVSAVFRVMPHAADKTRFAKIVAQMQQVKTEQLATFLGEPAKAWSEADFPAVSKTDADTFAGNFPAVMQFIVNHTTFHSNDPVDTAFLASMASIGIAPGKPVADASNPDGDQYRRIADDIKQQNMAKALDPEFAKHSVFGLFKTKGHINLELLTLQSVIGPIGLPAGEAIYPPVQTKDGEALNAMNDYVLHMSKEALPPAKAFWSMTLYDQANGFFIPNDRKKYSVGENAGMKLNADGGIDIYIAAEQPAGVAAENWLPINRKDEKLDVILRIYNPDLEAFKTYQMPVFEKLTNN